MNKHIYISLTAASLLLFSSCNDWLLEPTPGVTKLGDFFTNGSTAIQSVNAAYAPLMWEFNSTYYPEWFIGDVMSDDALKGGQNIGDMAVVYDLENFKTNNNNALLLDYYRAQYQGIARCNLALQEIPNVATDKVMDEKMKERLLAETHFLRAFYYFRLVRNFGGVPKIDYVIESANKWKQPRATTQEIYDLIISDLIAAEPKLWNKSEYPDTEMGRATKGAAQAMLLKVYLYNHNYTEAAKWGKQFMTSQKGEYTLCNKYNDNFTLAGENGPESVFEIQYMNDPTSDYGEGNGFSRGTFTVILTRSRSSQLGGGWGFNKPTQDLYNEFEPNDPRLNATILNPTPAQIENEELEIYLGCRYISRKYTLMNDDGTLLPLAHNSRGEINNKVIRYSDVLLMYAEACCEANQDLDIAQTQLNIVRDRVGMAIYKTQMGQVELRQKIRHERRVELAMEGHRWYDLCRWGIAKKTMDTYKSQETTAVQNQMATFIAGKHELLPIPAEEVVLSGLTQNPGY